MVSLAARPGVRIKPGMFDADPWLLGLENCILNLKTGEPVPAALDVLVSKRAPVSYDPTATCPNWHTYLTRVQPDPEVRKCLQQVVGSCLTGVMIENGLIFFYGYGGNGKGIFITVSIHRLLGLG